MQQHVGASTPEWLLRPRTVRLLSLAAGWFSIMLAFLYATKLSPAFGSSVELAQQSVTIRLALAVMGMAGAIAGLLLIPTMLWYWAKLDSSTRVVKVLWLLLFFFAFGFGFSLYAWLVYRKQAQHSSQLTGR